MAAASYIGVRLGLQVKEAICADRRIEGAAVAAIRVDVTDAGAVTLRGATSTGPARTTAEQSARSVRGVRGVENLLVVDASTTPAGPRASPLDLGLAARPTTGGRRPWSR